MLRLDFRSLTPAIRRNVYSLLPRAWSLVARPLVVMAATRGIAPRLCAVPFNHSTLCPEYRPAGRVPLWPPGSRETLFVQRQYAERECPAGSIRCPHRGAAFVWPQLVLIAEVRDYACGLLEHLVGSRVNHGADLGTVAGLLRQAIVALDGWLLLANEGAAQAARTEARVVWETALYQCWLRTMGRARWARQLFVSNLRRRGVAARRVIKDAEAHRQYEATWIAWRDARKGLAPGSASEGLQDPARDRARRELLEGPVYGSINRDFELEASRTGLEPEWHSPGPGGVKSVRVMAEQLTMLPDYLELYGTFAAAGHGSRADLHFVTEGGESIELAPIREPALLEADIRILLPVLIRMLLELINEYWPQDAATFQERVMARHSPPLPGEPAI